MALATRANKLRKRQRSIPQVSTVERLDATTKSAAGWVHIRPRVLGVPPESAKRRTRRKRCGRFISPRRKPHNNAKALETRQGCKAFVFNALIGLACAQILELFLGATRPFNLGALDLVALSQSESERQFRLREIA